MDYKVMDLEKIMQLLSNAHENYLLDTRNSVHITYTAKCMGGLEAILIILGVIKPGMPFVYQQKEKVFKLFWLIPIKYTRKESYPELILRLTEETLKK